MTTTIDYDLAQLNDDEKRDIRAFVNLPPATMKGATGDDDCFAVWDGPRPFDGAAASDDPWCITDAIGTGMRMFDGEGTLTLSASRDWRANATVEAE